MNRRSFGLALVMGIALSVLSIRADETALPGQGFDASRYEVLWTKSPFSVASSTDPVASPDYSLTGLGKFDGVSYANLYDKQKNLHFVLSSDKPVNGLTLISVARAQDPANSSAVIQKDGASITLKLETQAVQGGGPGQAPNMPSPMGIQPNPAVPPMPGQGVVNPGNPTALGPAQTPPPPLFHRHPVRVPPQPPH